MTTDFPQTQRSARSRWGFAAGAIAGVVVALAAIVTIRRAGDTALRMPRLTREAYDAASRTWDEHGPKDYNLDIAVTGNRPGEIHVEVRDGQATRMVRDGVQPSQQRTWYYWTVPGMLDMIGEELERVDDPARGFGAPPGSEVILRAAFDPEYGYPRAYSRVVAGQNLDMGWTVTQVTIIRQLMYDAKNRDQSPVEKQRAETEGKSEAPSEEKN